MRRALAALLLLASGCGGQKPTAASLPPLDVAAERYVRLALALGDRDNDSLDSYHGPPEWQADARARHAPLPEIRADATVLADSLAAARAVASDDEVRRAFLVRQLRAIAARVDILLGARPSVRRRDPLVVRRSRVCLPTMETPRPSVRRSRSFCRAPARCQRATRRSTADISSLPIAWTPCSHARSTGAERPPSRTFPCRPASGSSSSTPTIFAWSAFTRYEGRAASRIRVNAALPLTVDRALDLACHEAYPGHHTIDSLLDAASARRIELLVRPLFSPQSLLHEAAASLASSVAFPGPERLAFERDELFRWPASIRTAPIFTSASGGSSIGSRACRPRSPGSTSMARSTFRAPRRRSSAMR